MPSYNYKYCIIQTDEDDFYVECNDKATYGKIYASIPQTNSLRCIHGSDVPEGIAFTPNISKEMFGHDVIAVANGLAEPPWNFNKFKDYVKTVIKAESIEELPTTLLVICIDKRSNEKPTSGQNCIILATEHNLCLRNEYEDKYICWERVIDRDAYYAVRCAMRWLDTATANTWNIDKYYARLVSILGDEYIVRDKTETTTPDYGNQVHDRILVMCESHKGLVAADENLVLLAKGTYCPWRGITSKQIDDAANHIKGLFTEKELERMSAKRTQDFIANSTEKMHHGPHPKAPFTLPQSDVPTHWEVAMWLADGKGELLDTNNFNIVMHSFDYSLDKENEPLHPLEIGQYKVRLRGDTEWHNANIDYMGIPRWNLLKFYRYLTAKFPAGTFKVQDFIISSIYFQDVRIASDFAAYTSIEKQGDKIVQVEPAVPWDKLTDQDVMRLEQVINLILGAKK